MSTLRSCPLTLFEPKAPESSVTSVTPTAASVPAAPASTPALSNRVRRCHPSIATPTSRVVGTVVSSLASSSLAVKAPAWVGGAGGRSLTLAQDSAPSRPRRGAASTSQGHPYTIFRRALERGNLLVAVVTARTSLAVGSRRRMAV